MKFAAEDIAALQRLLAVDRLMQARRALRPSEWYTPSSPGNPGPFSNQIGFHTASHPIRCLFPGNGWGKTTAMGAEINAWGHHTNLWQKTPAWPVLMLWFTKLEDQFELIREQLQADIFGTEVAWKPSAGEFTWPDGSRLVLGLADRTSDWKKWQGVPVDLVAFDEQPPIQLWREMLMRRRGKRKTRFILGATATEGDSWMAKEIYQPWVDHHAGRGLDPTHALWEQSHPEIWLWWRGGVGDNPGADAGDVEWYAGRTWSSPKERQVRLHGGFESWTGDPVFDPLAIDRLLSLADEWDREQGAGVLGALVGVMAA